MTIQVDFLKNSKLPVSAIDILMGASVDHDGARIEPDAHAKKPKSIRTRG